jgi:hypothetical protein
MSLESARQLANTERNLALLEEQIAKARARPASAENAESVEALVRMANQIREEISRYRSRQSRRAS